MNVTHTSRKHNVCILGGSGFVGSHLAARLGRDGHRVRVVTRRRERHRDLLVIPELELVEANIYDPAALAQVFRGCDTVVNLIGILNEKGHDGKGFFRAHVELPRRVVDACRAAKVGRLLHMSALGADQAYGTSDYQRSKGEGENAVHAAHDLAVTSFRPSVIFGPGDSFFNRFGALLRLTPGVFPLACADARFAPVFVGDVVECYVRALDLPSTRGKRYDLCGPSVYTLKELVEYTARTLGLKRWVLGLPDGLSRLQANLLEYAPGKPFSRDNYLSLQKPNVCEGPFPEVFGIEPRSVESVVPYYLGDKDQRARYDEFRAGIRR